MTLMDAFPDLAWVNFGGGISVPYKPEEKDFPLTQYGVRLAETTASRLKERGVNAILEPGRYVVAQSGTLLARVTSKRISAGQEWVGCDTGFNHLARPSRYSSYHHIVNGTRGVNSDLRENFGRNPSGYSEIIVAGNLCESGDVFTRDENGASPRFIRATLPGDILAFCDAGAYGYSMASHYNARLLPAEVLVDRGKHRVIRRRQEYEELLRGQESRSDTSQAVR